MCLYRVWVRECWSACGAISHKSDFNEILNIHRHLTESPTHAPVRVHIFHVATRRATDNSKERKMSMDHLNWLFHSMHDTCLHEHIAASLLVVVLWHGWGASILVKLAYAYLQCTQAIIFINALESAVPTLKIDMDSAYGFDNTCLFSPSITFPNWTLELAVPTLKTDMVSA